MTAWIRNSVAVTGYSCHELAFRLRVWKLPNWRTTSLHSSLLRKKISTCSACAWSSSIQLPAVLETWSSRAIARPVSLVSSQTVRRTAGDPWQRRSGRRELKGDDGLAVAAHDVVVIPHISSTSSSRAASNELIVVAAVRHLAGARTDLLLRAGS